MNTQLLTLQTNVVVFFLFSVTPVDTYILFFKDLGLLSET